MENKKGFTLVELLVTITILGVLLGVGIYGFTKVISKSKSESYESSINTLKVVSETYLQANKEIAPKNIGDYIVIKISDLKESNYLKEDIYNAYGDSCMEKSFVKVYKSSQTDYVFTPFVYCGNDEVASETVTKKPSISVNFSKSSEVANPYFTYTIKGNDKDKDITVEGYTFIIYAKLPTDSEFQEVYNSGTTNGNKQTSISSKVFIRHHVDITSYTDFKVTITAINSLGGTETVTISPDNEYHDSVAPICFKTINQAKNFDDWVGKYSEPPTRTISIVCDDGVNTGSGCVRTNFAKTWPNDELVDNVKVYKFGADFADIVISDNAKNTTNCRTRVNVDVASPRINLRVVGNNNVLKTLDLGGYNESTMVENPFVATIGANDYDKNINPPKNDGKIWFNYTYKNGISIEVDATDNFYLDHWEWKVNKPGYATNTASSTVTSGISVSNTDGKFGNFNPREGQRDNTRAKKITVGFKEDGLRYGELLVYDKAGNYTKVSIYANLDKVAPDVPKDISTHKLKTNNISASNGSVYEKATWSNKFVRAEIESQYKKDSISGYETSNYRAFPHKSNTVKETGGGPNASFVFHDGYQGKNKIDFNICDYAGNCSNYTKKADIWIDTIDPNCKNKTTYVGTLSSYGWLGISETATVTGVCTDPYESEEKGSGCKGPVLKYLYNFEINTVVAGPGGDNVGGTYYDVAGNYTTCPVDQTVRIDYTYPSCSTKMTNTGTISSYGWLGKTETATITAHCNDDKGRVNSGCATLDFSHLYNYEIDTKVAGAKGDGIGGSVIDKADNEKACPADKTVRIDYTEPVCKLQTTNNGTLSSWGWLGIGESATVTPLCTDNNGTQNSNVKSGCDNTRNEFSYTYDWNINTTKAGALGDGNGGVTYDKADNPGKCKADQVIKIDHDAPTCSVSKINYGTEGPENWLEIGEHAVVKGSCGDTGGSGCVKPDISHDYNYDINTNNAGPDGNGKGGTLYDKADNSVGCAHDQLVKVDHTAPVCKVTKTTSKDENSKGWLNAVDTKGTATIKAECVETKEGAKSGCTGTTSYSHKYKTEIKTSTAGAKGDNNPGVMYDLAGNKTTCGFKTVKIDYTSPTCKVSQEAPGQNSLLWSGIGENVKVIATCSDLGGSKCAEATMSHTYRDQGKFYSGGAKGDGKGGTFYDNADNFVECPASEVFYIDHTHPECKLTAIAHKDWSQAGVTAQFECSDPSNSGIKSCAGFTGGTALITNIQKSKAIHSVDIADNDYNCCTISVKSKRQESTSSCNDHTACIPDGYTSWTYDHSVDVGTGCSASVYYPDNYTKRECEGNGMMVTYKYYTRKDKYKKGDSCPCTSWSSWSSWSDNESCSSYETTTKKAQCRTLYKYDGENCPDELSPEETDPDIITYKLFYNDNGGSGCSGKSVTRKSGDKWGTLCTPTRKDYAFVGWYYGSKVTSDSVATNDITVTAKWIEIPKCELQISGTTGNNGWYTSDVTVSFKSRTGTSYGLSSSTTETYNSKTSVVHSSSGTYTYYGYVKNSGATGECSISFKVDKDEPECGTASGASKTWTKDNRTITLGCSDNTSGCVQNTYSTTYSTSTKTDTVTITDKAGNTNKCKYNVYVDTDIPEFEYKCVKIVNKKSFVMTLKHKTIDEARSAELYNSLTKAGATYAIVIVFYDETSGIKSRDLILGDVVRGYNTTEWTTGTATSGVPGAGAPMKIKVRKICDEAGNCLYNTTNGHAVTCSY